MNLICFGSSASLPPAAGMLPALREASLLLPSANRLPAEGREKRFASVMSSRILCCKSSGYVLFRGFRVFRVFRVIPLFFGSLSGLSRGTGKAGRYDSHQGEASSRYPASDVAAPCSGLEIEGDRDAVLSLRGCSLPDKLHHCARSNPGGVTLGGRI